MKFLRILAAAAPLFGAALWAADHDIVTPESLFPQLDAILKHAVAQSPAMISRAVDLEMAENDRITHRAALLPSVAGSYSVYESRDERGDLPEGTDYLRVQKVYYNFMLAQPAFHWGDRKNTARIGEIKKRMAEGSYREGYRLLVQEVRTTYLRLIGDKLRAKRAAFYNKSAQTQLRLAEDRLTKRVISEAQMFNVRNDADRAQIIDERTQFDYENNKAAFARLTALPVLRDEEIPDAVPPVRPQVEALQTLLAGYLAQPESPAYSAMMARRTLDIERLNLAITKTRLRPKFNFVVGTSQDEQSYTLNTALKYSVQSFYAGVGANWTLFDGLATGAAKRTMYAKIRQLERDYRALSERLAISAQNQVKLVGFAARTVAINDRVLESSEGYLNTRRDEFNRGVISEEDLNASQLALYDNQIMTYTSRADYHTQVGEFLGTVTEDPVLANLGGQ